jgi:hypothetical protein
VDEKTLRYLRALREQVRGREPLEGDRRNVYTWEVAQQLGMARSEYEVRLAELEDKGYLEDHPLPAVNSVGGRWITDEGIAKADEE